MPVIEVEVGDDGALVKVPEPVQKLIDKAFGQGQVKAAEELRRQKSEGDPVAAEKLKALESENSKLKEAEAKARNDFAEAERLRSERHQRELDDERKAAAALKGEVDKRTTRIQELARKEIRVAAIDAGARKESLEELETLLGQHIALDDALQPFVQGKDAGKPLLDKDGKPVTVEGFVAQYLADHSHHKAAPAGRGGGAQGGRLLSGQALTGAEAERAEVLERVAANPTVANVAAAMSRIGKR